MKKLLLTLACALGLVSMASAETVTLNCNDATDIKGTENPTTYKEDGSVGEYANWKPLESLKIGDYTFTFTSPETGTNLSAYYTAKEGAQWTIRLYKDCSMTITAPAGTVMGNIILKGSNGKDGCLSGSVPAGATYASNVITWSSSTSASAVTFSFAGSFRVNTLEITTGEGSGEDPEPTPDPTPGEDGVIYSGLVETAAECDYTFENTTMPEELTYIWSWKSYNGKQYLNGSAYMNSTAYASEAYAVSPVIDLTATTTATLSFEHAAKFQTTLKELCGFCVREEGATAWTAIEIPTWPEAGSWNFANSGDIDLAAFAGKKIQIAFRYGSSASGADTWEIKNVKIVGEGGTVTPPVEPDPVEPTEVTVKNVKEIIALDSKTPIVTDFALTVGWVNNSNIFVCDPAGDFIQIYGSNTLAVGDVIPAGLKGTYELYNGSTPEITGATIPEATAGTFTPKEVAAADISVDLVNSVVLVKNVVLANGAPDEKENFEGTVGDVTLSLRNNYKIEGVPAGTYDITVVVTIYNGAPSLYAINYAAAAGIEGIEAAEAPAEYFNLQGIRVANPENGLFIRRQGNKVEKVLVK